MANFFKLLKLILLNANAILQRILHFKYSNHFFLAPGACLLRWRALRHVHVRAHVWAVRPYPVIDA